MKIRQRISFGLFFLFLFTGVTLASLTPARAQDVCDPIDQLLSVTPENLYQNTRALYAAEQAYLTLLEKDPGLSCALQGLADVADARCEAARQFVASGQPEQAKELANELRSQQPACALGILLDIQNSATPPPTATVSPTPTTTPPSPYERADNLAKAGLYEEARKLRIEAISSGVPTPLGSPTAIPGQEGNVPSERGWFFWNRIQAWGWKWPFWLIILAGISIPIVVFYRRSQLALDIDGFKPGVKLDFDPNEGLILQMEQTLLRLQEKAPNNSLGMVQAAADPIELGAELVGKEISSLWKLINQIFPIPVTVVSGTLIGDQQRGAGVSVRLINRTDKKLEKSQTFWQIDYDPKYSAGGAPISDAYYILSEVAAVWVYWMVVKKKETDDTKRRMVPPDANKIAAYLSRLIKQVTSKDGGWLKPLEQGQIQEVQENVDKDTRKELRDPFGTVSWQSYAYNWLAARFTGPQRKRMLLKALQLDGKNNFALYNMALVLKREIELETYPPANAPDPFKKPLDYLARLDDQKEQELGASAVDECQELSARDVVPGTSPDSASSNPKFIFAYGDYLRAIIEMDKYILSDGVHGNLPCAIQRLQSACTELSCKDEEKLNNAADMVFISLQKAIILNAGSSESIANEDWQKLRNLEKQSYQGILYNLACFYSRSGGATVPTEEDLTKSLELLDRCLEVDPEETLYAKKDPALKKLRSVKKADFAALPWPKVTTPGAALLSLPGINAHIEGLLREESITTTLDLLNASATPEERQALVEAIGIPMDRLYAWAKMADLLRLSGIDPYIAALLLAAGVDSLRELRQRDAANLHRTLVQTNNAENLVVDVPEINTLAAWIMESETLDIILESG